MDWFTAIIVYFLTWWLVFFMLLPIGIVKEDNHQTGHMGGAPKTPKIKQKALACTILSAFLLIFIHILIKTEIINLYEIANLMMEEDIQE
jgi:predicted secreted protein